MSTMQIRICHYLENHLVLVRVCINVISLSISLQVFPCKRTFVWVNMCCAPFEANNSPCVRVYANLFAPIFVCYSEVPPPSDTQTQTFTHKQLELNEAELSLVPISLIINNFSLPPNTLIILQRRLCVRASLYVCGVCVCLCLPVLVHFAR